MFHRYFVIFIMILNIANIEISSINIDTKNNESNFIPTKEWQQVESGQPLPTGLHIRYNVQTGKTEAKLLDGKEDSESEANIEKSKRNSLTLHPEKAITVEDKMSDKVNKPNDRNNIKVEYLKSVLKNIKADDTIDTDKKQTEEMKKKFKSYEEIKKDLEALNLNISTDNEILTDLFKDFEEHKDSLALNNLESSKVDDILDILNNMEYLIHQIDNARTFTDMNGMSKIISPSLNATDTKIKAEALKLLGAAVQSNPRVQLKALETDFVQKILHLLTVSNKIEIKSRCLFALGALVRHFPAAQKALINHGGLEVFGKLLMNNEPIQIQTRVMNLINDLCMERQGIKEIEDNEQRLRRILEYNATKFEEKLLTQNYCESLIDLMTRSMKSKTEIDDFHGTICESMIILSPVCKNKFIEHKEELLPGISEMLKYYRNLSSGEENQFSDGNLLHLLEQLLTIITGTFHDEL